MTFLLLKNSILSKCFKLDYLLNEIIKDFFFLQYLDKFSFKLLVFNLDFDIFLTYYNFYVISFFSTTYAT